MALLSGTLTNFNLHCSKTLMIAPDLPYIYDLHLGQVIWFNHPSVDLPGGESLTYCRAASGMPDPLQVDLIHPDDQAMVAAHRQQRSLATLSTCLETEYRVRGADGQWQWFNCREVPFRQTVDGVVIQLLGTVQEVTARKQQATELWQQVKRERWIRAIAQQIRQSSDLNQMLHTAVTEVQRVLEAERVMIYRLLGSSRGSVKTEALASGCSSLLGKSLSKAQLMTGFFSPSEQNESFRAVVPLQQQQELWGFLIVHKQFHPQPQVPPWNSGSGSAYRWPVWEIDLLQQVVGQLENAIHQAELYQQVQRLNVNLERQIQMRTAQLQLAFNFEATLKRITDKVRDSLDEDQILQTAVQELAIAIGVSGCNAALYDLEQGTSTIRYEYTTTVSPSHGRIARLDAFPEIYGQLFRGQSFQFCSITPSPVRGHVAMLSSPILDDQGVIGDLWLINHKYYGFTEQDIRLIEQVANQCAIAIRQARLYQKAQAQVEELERLHRLKDDFLSTVSHELRTPMSNIKMAIQMLEVMGFNDKERLPKVDALVQMIAPNLDEQASLAQRHKVVHYFQILKDECKREINLINDLLDLSRLDAGMESLASTRITLQAWLPALIGSFIERSHSHNQRLWVDVPAPLPEVITDAAKLERIIAELLNNACKYTPDGEEIRVSAIARGDRVQLQVQNSGVEIPEDERSRIFDKFYRIPNSDPWKHGGTGLGLALVKKLAELLGGQIWVKSGNQQTCFTVELPFKLSH